LIDLHLASIIASPYVLQGIEAETQSSCLISVRLEGYQLLRREMAEVMVKFSLISPLTLLFPQRGEGTLFPLPHRKMAGVRVRFSLTRTLQSIIPACREK